MAFQLRQAARQRSMSAAAEHDLAWAHVDEATGASSSLQGHNFPRRARFESVYSRRLRGTADATQEEGIIEEEEQGNEDNEQMMKTLKSACLMMMKWMTLVNPHIAALLNLMVKKMQWMILISEIFELSTYLVSI
jgi:hypothetical protein